MDKIEKDKTQSECLNAPVSSGDKLGEFGKANEDRWFREHEAELIEAAKSNRKPKAKKGDEEGQPKPKCCES